MFPPAPLFFLWSLSLSLKMLLFSSLFPIRLLCLFILNKDSSNKVKKGTVGVSNSAMPLSRKHAQSRRKFRDLSRHQVALKRRLDPTRMHRARHPFSTHPPSPQCHPRPSLALRSAAQPSPSRIVPLTSPPGPRAQASCGGPCGTTPSSSPRRRTPVANALCRGPRWPASPRARRAPRSSSPAAACRSHRRSAPMLACRCAPRGEPSRRVASPARTAARTREVRSDIPPRPGRSARAASSTARRCSSAPALLLRCQMPAVCSRRQQRPTRTAQAAMRPTRSVRFDWPPPARILGEDGCRCDAAPSWSHGRLQKLRGGSLSRQLPGAAPPLH